MNVKEGVVNPPRVKTSGGGMKQMAVATRVDGLRVFNLGEVHQEGRVDEKSATLSGWEGWHDIVAQTMGLSGIARHKLIQSGLQTNMLKDVLETFHGIPVETLLEAIGLSTKTLSRRVDSRLGPRHSDAAMALIEVTETAQRVLGSRALAEEWLTKPALALDGIRPLELISTSPGIESVKDLLTRMEYGVYA